MATGKLPHILLSSHPDTQPYTGTSAGGGKSKIPPRDRESHGQYLLNRFNNAWNSADQERAVSHATRNGVYLEFESDPGADLVTKSLEEMRTKKIRLLNIRTKDITVKNELGKKVQKKVTLATVFVDNSKRHFFVKKIEEYLTKESIGGRPSNQPLINSIADIKKALLVDSFWCDAENLKPEQQPKWVEVWLSTDDNSEIDSFEFLLNQNEIQHKIERIKFPERSIKVIFASKDQLEFLSKSSDRIAEYRLAKSTAEFFTSLENADQAQWINNLLSRTEFNPESHSVLCILDTGVNNGHPLLSPVLASKDCQAVNPNWGTYDHISHGTLMAGVAAYGDIKIALSTNQTYFISHRLESIKILPPPPDDNAANIWGAITSQAVSRAEIQSPNMNRTICMAITADDTRDQGRPSSWSAAIDQITSSPTDKRLFLVSAGNITTDTNTAAKEYPNVQLADSIHDPAQSWNAISVGAYTELNNIIDPKLNGYKPVANSGELSPFTTTSVEWEDNKWPIKPELVLEGGNLAWDNKLGFATECDDLSLLSTWFAPQQAHFSYFNMTSAATAQLAWMAAQLRAQYPNYWEETIRALLIHSAKWPDNLKKQFTKGNSKSDYKFLLKICGYGVPELDRAMYSAQNSLTLIAQSEIQPFDKRENGGGFRTKEMHFYELPWPKDVLRELPDNVKVKMKITLSYFIEPGPGEIGWKDRYRYASHGLRFDINSPGESKAEFIKRINMEARAEDEGKPQTQSASDFWVLGSQARNRGSVHSDTWKGTAAQLAASNFIAITPTIGWWRERHHLNKWNSLTRYSLVVSIEAQSQTVDVYTPVAVSLNIPIPIAISI